MGLVLISQPLPALPPSIRVSSLVLASTLALTQQPEGPLKTTCIPTLLYLPPHSQQLHSLMSSRPQGMAVQAWCHLQTFAPSALTASSLPTASLGWHLLATLTPSPSALVLGLPVLP